MVQRLRRSLERPARQQSTSIFSQPTEQSQQHPEPSMLTTTSAWTKGATKGFFPEKCSCPYFGTCQHFLAMKPKGRLQHARDPQICCNCLGPYKLAYCHSTQTCRTAGCNMKHHTLLHHSIKCTSTTRQDITIRIAKRRDDAMNCTSTAKTWKSQPSRLATIRNF